MNRKPRGDTRRRIDGAEKLSILQDLLIEWAGRHHLWGEEICRKNLAAAMAQGAKQATCPKGGRIRKDRKGLVCSYHSTGRWKELSKSIPRFSFRELIGALSAWNKKPWVGIRDLALKLVPVLPDPREEWRITFCMACAGRLENRALAGQFPRFLDSIGPGVYQLFDGLVLRPLSPGAYALGGADSPSPPFTDRPVPLASGTWLSLCVDGGVLEDLYRPVIIRELKDHCLNTIQAELYRNLKKINAAREEKGKAPLPNLVFSQKGADGRKHTFAYHCRAGGRLDLVEYRDGDPIISCAVHGRRTSQTPIQSISQTEVWFPGLKELLFSDVREYRLEATEDSLTLALAPRPGRTLSARPWLDLRAILATATAEVPGFPEPLRGQAVTLIQALALAPVTSNPGQGLLFTARTGSIHLPALTMDLLFFALCHYQLKQILLAVKEYNLNHFPMMNILDLSALRSYAPALRGLCACPCGGLYQALDLVDALKLECTLHGVEERVPRSQRPF